MGDSLDSTRFTLQVHFHLLYNSVSLSRFLFEDSEKERSIKQGPRSISERGKNQLSSSFPSLPPFNPLNPFSRVLPLSPSYPLTSILLQVNILLSPSAPNLNLLVVSPFSPLQSKCSPRFLPNLLNKSSNPPSPMPSTVKRTKGDSTHSRSYVLSLDDSAKSLNRFSVELSIFPREIGQRLMQ